MQLDPVDLEFLDSAPQLVKVERIIDASPTAIWDAVVDTARWCEWFPTMSRAESISPLATEGTTRTIKVGPLVAEERVVVADRPSRWGFTATRTNMPVAKKLLELIELEDVTADTSPRTLVRYTGAFQPLWFNRPLFSVVKRNVARTWRHGLDGLAVYVDAR